MLLGVTMTTSLQKTKEPASINRVAKYASLGETSASSTEYSESQETKRNVIATPTATDGKEIRKNFVMLFSDASTPMPNESVEKVLSSKIV